MIAFFQILFSWGQSGSSGLSVLLLENGSRLLKEDGGRFVLERPSGLLLLESGGALLKEDGGLLLLEVGLPRLLKEDGGLLLKEDGGTINLDTEGWPDGVILDPAGFPILDPDGNYILEP